MKLTPWLKLTPWPDPLAELFGTDDDGDGLGHIDIGIGLGGVGGGGEGADAFFFQPGEGVVGGSLGDGDTEEGADGGADNVGIIDVGAAVADDQGMGASSVGGAQHGAEVAGLFNVFTHDNEGDIGKNQVGECAMNLGAEGEEAFGAVAVGDLAEDDIGALEERDVE